ncbi:MAG: hypothetical protein J5I92_15060 [Thiogranum sp.]|nr:hypothetical protein [Thiogranum sp.]
MNITTTAAAIRAIIDDAAADPTRKIRDVARELEAVPGFEDHLDAEREKVGYDYYRFSSIRDAAAFEITTAVRDRRVAEDDRFCDYGEDYSYGAQVYSDGTYACEVFCTSDATTWVDSLAAIIDVDNWFDSEWITEID